MTDPTPSKPAEEPNNQVSPSSRLLASAIDIGIISLLLVPFLILLFSDKTDVIWPYLGNTIPAWGLILGYNLFKLDSHGQTIGKQILKLHIVNSDGSSPKFTRLLFRRYLPLLIVAAIPYVGVFLLLAILLSGLFNNGVSLHDRFSQTHVVRIPLQASE